VAIIGFVLFQIANRIQVGFWDPFIVVAFFFGMPLFLLVSALLEVIFSSIAVSTSPETMVPKARRKWVVHEVLKRRRLCICILALLVLILLGYGWLPPFSIYLIILLCSIRLWLLGKKSTLLCCFLFF
jgi:cobalamin synthase